MKGNFEAFMVFFSAGGLIALPSVCLSALSGVLCWAAKARGWTRWGRVLSILWKVCLGIWAVWLALTFLWLFLLRVSM